MTREEAIKLIGSIKGDLYDLYDDNDLEALDMAIASLKTDEAYQLEYENRDFVEIPKGTTNGDVIQALFPIARIYKEEYVEVVFKEQYHTTYFTLDFWNAPYQKGSE